MRRPTILIADDHKVLAESLGHLLREQFDVVSVVFDGAALIEAAERLKPDVVITDLQMPSASGLAAVTRLKAAGITSKVIVLTMHAEAGIATRALKAGASGFLHKSTAGEELIEAISHVLLGRVYLPASITRDVLDSWGDPQQPLVKSLTARQLDVLRLIAEGHRMKEIGTRLGLSTRTVETHKYEMMRALGVQSTAALVRYAVDHGLT